jgi:folylpolyglutamate synthase/dihydropteroate synthase
LGAKAIAQMLAILAPEDPQIIATAPTVAGRLATAPEAIASQARSLGLEAIAIADPRAAVGATLDQADVDDVVLVTGSLFLVSQVRPLWQHLFAEQ